MGVGVTPLGFVAVDVASDLGGAGAERPDIVCKLDDLARVRVEGESVGGEHGAKAWVGHDSPVADAVDGVDRVADPDRVQTTPAVFGEHSGVDLKMQMPVWIAGARRAVPHDDGLDLADRNLHLRAPGSNASCRMLGYPTDDLTGRCVLRRVVRGGNIRVQLSCQRPGFGSVDDHLDEPNRALIVA
jgi:hypothetical protein